MALIGVVGDTNARVDVLALSEAHYIVDMDYTFITEEFLIKTSANMQCLYACVHGELPSQHEEIERVSRRWSFMALLRHGHNDVNPLNGIYDHSGTWQLQTDTNMYYEGPGPFKKVQPIAGRPESEKRIYGCPCHIVAINCVPRRTAFGSVIEITRRAPSADFQADAIYALRFAYYLKRPTFNRPLAHRLLFMPYGQYKAHVFSYPQEAVLGLQTEGMLGKLQSSRLHLTLSPFVASYKGADSPQDGGVTEDELEAFKTMPTTVVWFVVPKGWTFRIDPLTMERDDSAFQLVNSEYVLPTARGKGAVPYRESYVKLATHVNRLRGTESLTPGEHNDIICLINPRRTARALAEIARDSIPFLALAIAVVGLYRGQPGQPLHALDATQLLLWSLGLYAAVVALRIVYRYFIPEVWRRVSVRFPV